MDTTTTNSVDSVKMENVDDEFEAKLNDIKVEKIKFEDMDMPDYIDIKEEVIERAIKQEDLIIKSESLDFGEDNISHVERNLHLKACLRSTSMSEDESTIEQNANHSGYDIETMHNPQFENHKKQWEDVGMLSFGEVGYKIKNEYLLKSHKQQHKTATEIEMFICGMCNYQAKSECDIKAHMLLHKCVTVETFICGKCDYQTKSKNNLKGHILRHKSERGIEIFSCGECNLQTKCKQSFTSHMLQHKCPTEIEIFCCEECDYRSNFKSSLKRHKLRHKRATKNGMFRCRECPYQAKHKTALTMHNKFVHKSVMEIEMLKYIKNLKKHQNC